MLSCLRESFNYCTKALLGAVLVIAPIPASADEISEQEAYAIGVEAYIYLYPLISMDITRIRLISADPARSQESRLMNVFLHARTYPNAKCRAVVSPNFDTLYSCAWLDLTEEPVILSLPDTNDRYYLLEMLDMWTDVFAAPGKRTSGTAAMDIAVVPPKWSGTLPPNVHRIDAPTPYVWCIGRIQTNGPDDYAAVNKLQNGFEITPLSRWSTSPAAASIPNDLSTVMKIKTKDLVNNMSPERYFTYAADLLKIIPPHTTDQSIITRMTRIGLVPGQRFEFSKQPRVIQRALIRAAIDGIKLIREQKMSPAAAVNGWGILVDGTGEYGNHYLKRAVVAMSGLGANRPVDVVYPTNVCDADGEPLNGGNNYILHFSKDDIPPTDAFWSITVYDKEGFPVANHANRFAISSHDNLKFNPDGSLDIYLQHSDPGPDKAANWLPIPTADEMTLTMRLFAPKPEVLKGIWAPPPVRKIK